MPLKSFSIRGVEDSTAFSPYPRAYISIHYPATSRNQDITTITPTTLGTSAALLLER